MQTHEPLLDLTYRLIDAVERDPRIRLTQRALAAKARVDFNWYIKFKGRQIDDPGVKKVQRVHDVLIGVRCGTPAPATAPRRRRKSTIA